MKIFPLVYTEKETSLITSISISKLQKSRKEPFTNIKEGTAPPFIKINGSVRYKREDVMDFIDNLTSIAKPHDAGGDDNNEKKSITNKKNNSAVNSSVAPYIDRCDF